MNEKNAAHLSAFAVSRHLLAAAPTNTWPSGPRDTIDGVVCPSAVGMMRGTPASTTCRRQTGFTECPASKVQPTSRPCMHYCRSHTATAELVVPRSMPTLRSVCAADPNTTCMQTQCSATGQGRALTAQEGEILATPASCGGAAGRPPTAGTASEVVAAATALPGQLQVEG